MSAPNDGNPKRPSPPQSDKSQGGDNAKHRAAPANDNTSGRHDKGEIKSRLSGRDLLNFYGAKWRESGAQARLQDCPLGGRHGGDSPFHVRLDDGRWDCKVCGVSGDSLALVAAYEGIDTARDFERVLARASEIANINPSGLAVANDNRRAIVEPTAEGETAAHLKASRMWRGLGVANENTRRGLRAQYLKMRGCGALIDRPDLVRFRNFGFRRADGVPMRFMGPSVALYSLLDSRLINVATRQVPDERSLDGIETWTSADAPTNKAPVLQGCTTRGTLVHSLADVERHSGDIIVCEGIVDTLTAVLAFVDSIAVGANGAGRVALVTAAVASIAARQGRHVRLAFHNDESGIRAAKAARLAALEAGLPPEQFHLIPLEGFNDLNDWWLAQGGER